MLAKADNSELLITDTLVPDIFITQYIQELSKNAICLYMWLLMIIENEKFTQKDTEAYSVISSAERNEAFAELISTNLVTKSGEDLYALTDIKRIEVDEYCKALIARGDTLDGLSLSKDTNRDMLAQSISKTFYLGKMANINYRLIDKCLYEYKFDSAVVYSLFEEATNRKIQYKITPLEKLAEEWFKKGYTTTDKLNKMFASRATVDEALRTLGKLRRQRLDGLDIEKVEKWVMEYNYSSEMIEYAYRCNDFRTTITLKNVGDKLKEWYLSDIKTIDQAAVFENKKHEENKAKATRRKPRGNAWKTGSEMGITSEKTDSVSESSIEKKASSDEEDEILNLFGGVDADN